MDATGHLLCGMDLAAEKHGPAKGERKGPGVPSWGGIHGG